MCNVFHASAPGPALRPSDVFEQLLHLGPKKIEFHIPAERSVSAQEEEEEEEGEEETQEEAAGDEQHTSQEVPVVITVVQDSFLRLMSVAPPLFI